MATSTEPKSRTQQERRAESEDRMLDAAAGLFAARGVGGTSLAEIGLVAGYSRGLPSQHFGSKAVLVSRLLDRSHERFLEQLNVPDGLSVVDAITAAVSSYLDQFVAPGADAQAQVVLWADAFPVLADGAQVCALNDRAIGEFARLLEMGRADGTISALIEPESFGATLLALLRGAAGQLLVDPSPANVRNLQTGCVAMTRQWLSAG